MMKVCWMIFLFSSLLFSCSKEQPAAAHAYMDLLIDDHSNEIMWEEVNAVWHERDGIVLLDCISDQYDQLRLNLSHVQDTGLVDQLSLNNIHYINAVDFIPSKLAQGYLRITKKHQNSIEGQFEVKLENSLESGVYKKLKGRFGIVVAQ